MADLRAGERMVPPERQDALRRDPPESGRGGGRPPKNRSRQPRRRSPLRVLGRLAGLAVAVVAILCVVGGAVAYQAYERFAADLPTVDGLRQYQPRVMSRIYASDDQLIAELAAERRIFVPFTAIPDLVKQAFVSAEDQKFWSHGGVDPVAMARAAVFDISQLGRNRRPIGASTITQQVAKNMLLGNNEVSLSRKLKEAILAIRIEETLPKERILELYLNEIYLGLQSYGVAAAAQTYFDKPLDQLTVAEAAFLGALPKAPNNYNPFRFPEAARARRDWVIDRMMEDHAITPQQAADAKATPLTPSPRHRHDTVPGGDWFGEEVRRQLVDRFGADITTTGGMVVRTSLNPALQATADHALRQGLMAYDRAHGGWRGPVGHMDVSGVARAGWSHSLATLPRPPGMLQNWRLAVVLEASGSSAKLGWNDADGASHISPMQLSETEWARATHNDWLGPVPRRITDVVHIGDVVMVEPAENGAERVLLRQVPKVQGALVSLDPTTGRVLAMSGGWAADASQFNRAIQAQRQPGSSFKPMVYLTAMEQGISPSQKVLDGPFELDQGAAGVWRPGNYEGTFGGPTPLHMALEQSLNLVTVRLAQKIGMTAVAYNAIAFHVVDQMSHYLPNALGAVDTTVMRQAGAYAALDEGGREVVPRLIDSIQDRDGHVIWRAPGIGCNGCNDPSHPPTLVDERKQIADPQSVFQVVEMMRGVMTRGTGAAIGKALGRTAAGKTGTSQDFNDAWFVGFTPDLVTAVWVGFDTPASLGKDQQGAVVAGPIWRSFMQAALQGRPDLSFHAPDGVTVASWGGGAVDAFKPGQVPGASGPTIGGGDAPATDTSGVTASSAPSTVGTGTGTGVDSGLGGLY